jgi:hypothetical protein
VYTDWFSHFARSGRAEFWASNSVLRSACHLSWSFLFIVSVLQDSFHGSQVCLGFWPHRFHSRFSFLSCKSETWFSIFFCSSCTGVPHFCRAWFPRKLVYAPSLVCAGWRPKPVPARFPWWENFPVRAPVTCFRCFSALDSTASCYFSWVFWLPSCDFSFTFIVFFARAASRAGDCFARPVVLLPTEIQRSRSISCCRRSSRPGALALYLFTACGVHQLDYVCFLCGLIYSPLCVTMLNYAYHYARMSSNEMWDILLDHARQLMMFALLSIY